MTNRLTIQLDVPLAERVKQAAADAGIGVNEFVARALEFTLDDWAEDLRRLAEPDESIPAEEALAEFEVRVAELLVSRAIDRSKP